MPVRSLALAALLTGLATSAFAAETSSFDIFGRGNLKTANVSLSLDKTKDGPHAHAIINYTSALAGTLVDDYKITPDGIFVLGTSTKRDAQQTTFTTSKPHDALTISVVLDKQPIGRRDLKLQIPSFLVLLPDDPSIWQLLLDTAAAHPHADNVYYLLVPAADAKSHDRIEAFTLNAGGDQNGTLDGKPIPLQHFAIKFKDNSIGNLYTDAQGKLMQVEAPTLGVKQIRSGFALAK
jgi:hypothetical protein